jgi:hypothetical protein
MMFMASQRKRLHSQALFFVRLTAVDRFEI